jgi:hypothetical protein
MAPHDSSCSPKFDSIRNPQYNSVIVTGRVPLEDLLALLAQKQLPTGGWGALSSSSQTALEPTALACIAVSSEFEAVHDRATRFLLGVQNLTEAGPRSSATTRTDRGLLLLRS